METITEDARGIVTVGTKKRTVSKKSPKKNVDINTLKSNILSDVNNFIQEQEKNNPQYILSNLKDEIQAMNNANIPFLAQLQILKKNGFSVGNKAYKEFLELNIETSSENSSRNVEQILNLDTTY